jgi:hypothetical protein
LRPLRLTNPDAPVIEHVLDLQLATGEKSIVAPVLFAKQPYDPAKMTRMFAYLQFQLMEVRRDDAGQMRPVLVDGDVQFHPPSHPDYTRQIGRNTRYIIHPEEVLADNFADLIVGRSDAPDPWVVDRMRRVLQAFRNR